MYIQYIYIYVHMYVYIHTISVYYSLLWIIYVPFCNIIYIYIYTHITMNIQQTMCICWHTIMGGLTNNMWISSIHRDTGLLICGLEMFGWCSNWPLQNCALYTVKFFQKPNTLRTSLNPVDIEMSGRIYSVVMYGSKLSRRRFRFPKIAVHHGNHMVVWVAKPVPQGDRFTFQYPLGSWWFPKQICHWSSCYWS